MTLHLDLDDVAAGHPKAQAELDALRNVLKEANRWRYSSTVRSERRLVEALEAHDALTEPQTPEKPRQPSSQSD